MTAFLISAAALTLVAVAFAVWPFLRAQAERRVIAHDAANVAIYEDQLREIEADLASGSLSLEQFEQAKTELERRLLQEVRGEAFNPRPFPRWPALLIAALLPVTAAGLYWKLGNPAALAPAAPVGAAELARVEELLPRIEKHLAEHPDDLTGWKMLGKVYMALERYPDAVRAFAELNRRNPRDAQVLADYADALAMAQGQRLAGKPSALLKEALALDPDNLKALYLSGFAALEANDAQTARRHWQALLALLPPDSQDAQVVRARLAELPPDGATAKPPIALRVKVSLDARLANQVRPEQTVFVFARAPAGPPMPLAIARLAVKDLPAEVVLDATAMLPGGDIEAPSKVVVGARVSKSGDALPRAGDLEGFSPPVRPEGEARVIIDTVRR